MSSKEPSRPKVPPASPPPLPVADPAAKPNPAADESETPPGFETRIERAEIRTEQAEARTEQAETRTEQAKTRTERAEVRTEQAETRTEEAKTRTEMAEIRTEQAETRSEQAIRASELNYRRLFEAARDGILILEADTGRISDVNPALLAILGFSHAELVGTPIWELGTFRDVVDNKAKFEQLHRQGYVLYENLSLETKAGRRIVVEFVGNVYQVGDHNVIQCNVRDITDRKKSEQQLVLLNACVSHFNDIVLVMEASPLDEPGPQIVFANEALERRTGYTAAEVIGRSPRFLEGPKTDQRILDEIRAAMSQRQPVRRQLVHYTKDGAEFWVDVDVVPIFGARNECTHFVAIQRDITDHRRSEARFRRLIDSNAQGVIFWNAHGEVTDANDAFLRTVNYTREELETGSINWIARTPPEYADLDRRALAELAARGACTPYEKEFIRKDGSRVPILVGAANFEDNPEDGVAFVLDLTERKKLEKQFLRAQRMESIGTLAGGIAHDLNNILAPIMMSIQLLKDISENPRAGEVLATIETSARRGADIVRQVLSFARGLEGERVEIQPRHLLSDLENIIKGTFPKNIKLEFGITNSIWTILGDPTQVQQILLNLCVNARDAMPDGGTLSVTMEDCVLDEQYIAKSIHAEAGRFVKITVTDSGTGVPLDLQDKIFEPFFTTKDVTKGTGLGLSTVMAIVKSHKGIINLYSEPGTGSTFRVYLPALESHSEIRRDRPEEVELPRGNGETILVVDDEASILAVTSQTLKAFGYHVLPAADGAVAVALYAQHQAEIAVVLTDIMMPVMDGVATIRVLRQINPAVKIIATSGLNANGSAVRAPGLNVRHFLTKPYMAANLLTTLRDVLREPAPATS